MLTKFNKTIRLSIIKGVVVSTIFISCKTTKPTQQNSIHQPQIIQQNNEVKPNDKSDTNTLADTLQNAHVSICVFDASKNTFLTSYQSEKFFIPASNLKIATCYIALKYLSDSLVGLNYTEDDTSIQIQGTGDPTFLNANFKNQLVFNWLKTKSNKKIYLLNSKFSTTAFAKGWSWDDYLEPFMPERTSFPIYENAVTFNNSNGFKAFPKYFENKIVANFEASNNNNKFNVTRSIGSNNFAITPGNNLTKTITFSTEADNPVLQNRQLAQLLGDTLKLNIVNKPVLNYLLDKKVYSQLKDEVLQSMMFRSDNFIAEQLLLMVSNELFKEMDENKLIQYLLHNDFNELPQTPRWVDGSGLSRYNLFTTQDVVFILNKMKSEFGWQRMSKIFPKGNEGTLKNMFLKNSNQVYAKSGSLSNIYCLSGYLIANSGKEFIFSIMVNNHQLKTQQVKNIIENYVTTIIEKN